VNKIRLTDFLFSETSCGFGGCPFCLAATASGESELALYSLTERARYPFHAEPTHCAPV